MLLGATGLALAIGAVGVLAHTSLTTPKDAGQRPPDVTEAPSTTVVPTTVPASIEASTTTGTSLPAVEPSILSTAEFDPPPGDGKENPGLLGKLIDSDPKTWWTSLCYDDPALGEKAGVGVILELSAPAAGFQLEVRSPTTHWSASVYVSETRPDRLRAWGPPVASQRDVTKPATTFSLGSAPGRYVLLWITRLGRSQTCKLPYDIRVSEVRVTR